VRRGLLAKFTWTSRGLDRVVDQETAQTLLNTSQHDCRLFSFQEIFRTQPDLPFCAHLHPVPPPNPDLYLRRYRYLGNVSFLVLHTRWLSQTRHDFRKCLPVGFDPLETTCSTTEASFLRLGRTRSSSRDPINDHIIPQQPLHGISRLDMPISPRYLYPQTTESEHDSEHER
jgi:hypothetical protein